MGYLSQIRFGNYDSKQIEKCKEEVEDHYKNSHSDEGIFWMETLGENSWSLVIHRAIIPEDNVESLNDL